MQRTPFQNTNTGRITPLGRGRREERNPVCHKQVERTLLLV